MMREIFVSTLCAIFASNMIGMVMLNIWVDRSRRRTAKMFEDFEQQSRELQKHLHCPACGESYAAALSRQISDATKYGAP